MFLLNVQHDNKLWNKYNLSVFFILLTLAAISLFAGFVDAYNAPATTDPGYTFYDLFFNKGLNGPIGTVIGGWILIMAGSDLNNDRTKSAVLKGLAGGAIIEADSLATSLGWLI